MVISGVNADRVHVCCAGVSVSVCVYLCADPSSILLVQLHKSCVSGLAITVFRKPERDT